jgi:hypothetical protein
MESVTRLVCPHCHAILKASKALAVGKQVQCLRCQAPFSVSAADVANAGIPLGDFHAGCIQVGASLADEQSLTEQPSAESSREKHVAAQPPEATPTKESALPAPATGCSTPTALPYLPPPVTKPQVAQAYYPPSRFNNAGLGMTIVGATLLLLGMGGALTWNALVGGDDDALAALTEPPPAEAPALPEEHSGAQIPGEPPGKVAQEPAPPIENGADEAAPSAPAGSEPEPAKEKAAPKQPPAPEVKPVAVVKQPLRPPVTAEQQKNINAAIQKGVRYLKGIQQAQGSWTTKSRHEVGYAALPGLTLLECEVPAKDPVVQRAAVFVRRASVNLTDTYDLALAILFLDRLGERSDHVLIQQLALRLVAGQKESGGWGYDCPLLSLPEMSELMLFLQRTRPKAAKLLNPVPKQENGNPDPLMRKQPDKLDNLLQPAPSLPLSLLPGEKGASPSPKPLPQNQVNGIAKSGRKAEPKTPQDATRKNDDPAAPDQADKKLVPPAGGTQPVKDKAKPNAPKVLPKNALPGKEDPAGKPPILARDENFGQAQAVFPPEVFPQRWKSPPKGVVMKKGRRRLLPGRDDNSNSQFAMLALWAARRYGVPTENTLALVKKRYHDTQNIDGGWGYVAGSPTSEAMTGTGLLGLAVGHGTSEKGLLAAVAAGDKKRPGKLLRDPAIDKGLQAFARFIGTPENANRKPFLGNLYFLWTVERVAMLYNLHTIGNKDWYGWGVQMLLANQFRDGSWFCNGQYPGADLPIDTSFALLFLKRSNLVQDLTDNLNFYLAIIDPGAQRTSPGEHGTAEPR